ncbi:MAG: hypothetical protein RLY71_3427 [Pseudomonadota bacterium]|jgi:hypothetical protein
MKEVDAMSTTDGRQYSEEALQLLRRQAHRLRHELNLTWLSIAEIVGVNLATLMSWVRRFHLNRPELGEVSSQVRGRRYGAKRTLSESDEQALRETVLPRSFWMKRYLAALLPVLGMFAGSPCAQAQEYWIPCARDSQICYTPYQTDIRYGVGYWDATRQANVFNGPSATVKGGPVHCSAAAFGYDPVPGQTKTCMYLGLFRKCADEGGRCVAPGKDTIFRYGANGSAVVLQSSSDIDCSNEKFGRDPVPGAKKYCQYLITTANFNFKPPAPQPPKKPVPQPPTTVTPQPGKVPEVSALAAFQRGILSVHNKYRCLHGVPPLQWDGRLADYAQKWVDGLARQNPPQLMHSNSYRSTLGALGENLYLNSDPQPEAAIAAVASWYGESNGYAYGRKPTDLDNYSKRHFTAMIWKGARFMGCGTAKGVTSCNYAPADANLCSVTNMEGCFETQVQMKIKSEQECP